MIYTMTTMEPFAKDFALRDQVRRAAISVMANIAEGFDAYSNKECVQFLGYSKRSAAEVSSHLHIAFDVDYIANTAFEETVAQAEKCRNLIKGYIKYLRSK
jgi:four helix bundle protein